MEDNIQLYAMDYDGTLAEGGEMPDEVVEGLRTRRELGDALTIITGRTLQRLEQKMGNAYAYLRDQEVSAWVGTMGGSRLTNVDTGETITRDIPEEAVQKYTQILGNMGGDRIRFVTGDIIGHGEYQIGQQTVELAKPVVWFGQARFEGKTPDQIQDIIDDFSEVYEVFIDEEVEFEVEGGRRIGWGNYADLLKNAGVCGMAIEFHGDIDPQEIAQKMPYQQYIKINRQGMDINGGDKAWALRTISDKMSIPLERVAYAGDDLDAGTYGNDAPVLGEMRDEIGMIVGVGPEAAEVLEKDPLPAARKKTFESPEEFGRYIQGAA